MAAVTGSLNISCHLSKDRFVVTHIREVSIGRLSTI